MRGCPLAVTTAVLVLTALAPPPAAGQPDARDAGWTALRTADGQPDLQGFWANNSATPMQRPEILGDSELTAEQLSELSRRVEEFRETAQQAGHLLGDRLFQRALGNSTYQDFDDQTGDYNTFWLVQREFENRTSLIIDPPSGRIPPVTPAAQRRAAERAAYAAAHPSDGPEFRPMNDRCLNFASPRVLGGYNSYFLIVQTPDHVAILQEQGHIARVIPLDGRPQIDDGIRLWTGSARGRWEGETLVIETANYSPQSRFLRSSEHLRLVERWTRVAPDTIQQDITMYDPTTWTRPWTIRLFLKQTQDPLFEFACHEGNYSMESILAGARAEEAAAAAGAR